MEVTVFEGGEPIGTLQAEENGLFWEISCTLERRSERILRIFVLSALDAAYLGIPNADGVLHARLAKRHLPNGIDGAAATTLPRGQWKPWRGVIDGVAVGHALLQTQPEGVKLALAPEEAVNFPAWVRDFQTERVNGVEYAALALDAEGHLPLKDRKCGGNEHEENGSDFADFGVPVDAPAGDGVGEQGRETDCPDV